MLAELPDLINQALEVYENEDGLISVNTYNIPPPQLVVLQHDYERTGYAAFIRR